MVLNIFELCNLNVNKMCCININAAPIKKDGFRWLYLFHLLYYYVDNMILLLGVDPSLAFLSESFALRS